MAKKNKRGFQDRKQKRREPPKPQVTYHVTDSTDNIVWGKLDLEPMKILVDDLEKEIDDNEFLTGEVGSDAEDADDYSVDFDTRISHIQWIYESKTAQYIARALATSVNEEYFDINISKGGPDVQYTVYKDPNDHYDWHQDHYDDDLPDDDHFKRTLSLSLCLTPSEMYDGAELFVRDGDDLNVQVFKMGYGDFVIFPSTVEHRINALRSGERRSLVVWYGEHWA